VKYRQLNGKENKLRFGVYPEVSLIEAREKRDGTRKLLAVGVNPGRAKDEEARYNKTVAENFE
jgi:hypothetical protein